jgi:cytochrome c oxidase assembly protein subunit 15
LLLLLTVVLLVWAHRSKLRPANWLTALLVVQVVQVAVGIYQARNGLPPLAVGVHMVLASLTAATMTVAVLRLKKPAVTEH